ncbi:protein NRT1/ PTR FAMILY 4.5-like [Rhododendron vialii]|uniref:protein NRT1/ PTR FAMILY 4.5-like n=1 Tax=Rhododendron vialii TaxID=182163 RepID=UPI00265EB17F|nr:protein NRT1/ PTR FAMILY 4.5-like [Rhododendron vialii]
MELHVRKLLVKATFSFENIATLALATNLVTYLTQVMHINIADAANQTTNYMGTSYILSIFIAILADMHIGRPKSVLISACFETVGLGLLAIQAHSSKLKPPPCDLFDPTAHCVKVGGGHAALLFGGLYLVAAGSAGIKASLPSHGADQFEEKDPKEAKQMSSFFNWFLLSGNIGTVISLTLVVWIQDNKGWDLGFGMSSISMVVGAFFFTSGLPRYRIQVIQKSNAFVEVIQVYVAAFHNRNLRLPEDPEDLFEIDGDKPVMEIEFLPHRDVYKFLDKAAIQSAPAAKQEKPNPWKLCRVTQVENAKIILGVLPIFCCAIIMTLCVAQLQTFSIQQAITMDTRITKHFHIPPASLAIIPIIFLLVLVPIYDRLFVPFARRITGHPTGITHLQRIGVGLVLSCLSMAVAGIIEVKRKEVARKHNMLDAIPVIQPLPMSVFWLSFQFFIFGIADLFSFIGLLEFFYSQAPKGMKSISTCFLWCSMALGFFLSTITVNIVNSATKGLTSSRGWLGGNNINRNYLNLFYWLLSLLSFLNFLAYLFVAKSYNYKPIAQAVRSPTIRKVLNDQYNKELEDIEVQK